MRCSAWSSLATSACRGEARLALALVLSGLTLVLAAPAHAHVDPTPTFLAADSTETISFAVHNDREIPLSSFQVEAPPELRIEDAAERSGWTSSTDGRIATWSGGSVPWNEAVSFELSLAANSAPGAVALATKTGYPDSEVLHNVVPLTVVPADEASSAGYVWVAVVAGAVLVGLVSLAVALRRRHA